MTLDNGQTHFHQFNFFPPTAATFIHKIRPSLSIKILEWNRYIAPSLQNTIELKIYSLTQWDQIGRFLEFHGNKFYYKNSPNVWWLFWQVWKPLLFKTNWWGYFWATFGKTWAHFYFNIWSHWSYLQGIFWHNRWTFKFWGSFDTLETKPAIEPEWKDALPAFGSTRIDVSWKSNIVVF